MELIVKGADFSNNRIGKVEKKINTAVFNGTSSYASITPITLSSNGDYIEFLLNVENENANIGHYFAVKEIWGAANMGVSKGKVSIRLDGNAWVVNAQTISPSDTSNMTLKISYEDTNVKVYIDNTLAFTYDNSSTEQSFTINGFGRYTNSSQVSAFWKGQIKKIKTNKHNDGEWLGVDELPGWSATDVVLV